MDAGALGGKICGAGGGGFLLLYIPRENQDKVRESLKDYRELPFMLETYGSRIIFNVRSYPTK
jgi:D-glycero-alpha-D-manno-heptose-7-phosphate kinase